MLNNNRPLVTIVTVCYNALPQKIQKTFDSIINQTYCNIEFVVIDGGSNHITLDTIKLYRDNISVFISEKDEGIFDAMNKGIRNANGDWIIFMNIGDYFYSYSVIENLVPVNEVDVDIICGDVVKEHGGLIKANRKLSKFFFYYEGLCHQSIIVKRLVFEKIGFFEKDLKLYGDTEWVMRAFQNEMKFLYVPVIVSFYEGGGASSSYKKFKHEKKHFITKHFNFYERILYKVFEYIVRIKKRLY